MGVKVSVSVSGLGKPWDPAQRLDNAIPEIHKAVAEHGLGFLRTGTRVFKNPTGFYKSNLRVEHFRVDSVITDGGVIYGPWLQYGGGSFSGYQLFSKTVTELDRRGTEIAEQIIDEALEGL